MKIQDNRLISRLKENLNEYKSIPFWSWNNNLDEDELTKQIDEMKSVGIGGFIMHARTGLKDEYLGEKWFSCIAACLKRARELKMNAWVYDENGWPSGFVGGKLLKNPDFLARYLEYEIKDNFDDSAFAVYKKIENGYKRIFCAENIDEYHTIYLRVSPANTDILNPTVVDEFIRETHEKYYERFKDSFGKELVGFFTDEPQYYRYATPYTKGAEAIFAKDGEDIKDGLIYLFVHDENGYRFRTKYFLTLNKLYVEVFYKKVFDWCNAHGCMLTGHSIEENTLSFQMLGGANVMTSYEYEHIPAIDWLGRTCFGLGARQIGSVASQLGIKRLLTETYACCGFDVTPYELKCIGETQYFYGINMTCQHLYPYSISAQGKFDHPPVFSRHSGWFDGFKSFNDYFTRLGCIMAETRELCDVAVIHPMRSVYLEYVRLEDQKSVEKLESDFNELLEALRVNGILYHFVDETILERHGSIDGKTLKVGEYAYKTVIIPKMKSIGKNTYKLLKQFNGNLLLTEKIEFINGEKAEVELKTNITFEDIYAKKQVGFRCLSGAAFITARQGELGKFIFVKNPSLTDESEISFDGVAEEYLSFNVETLEFKHISDRIKLRAGASLILVKDEDAKPLVEITQEKDLTADFAVSGITDNYLVMDYAEMSKNGIEYESVYAIQGIMEKLLRENYKGIVYIRQKFVLNDVMPLKLITEKAQLLTATVNGKAVTFQQSAFDINFVETDITKQIKIGENIFEYSLEFYQHDGVQFALFDPHATESMRNCLYYDTSIESAYIKGDFTVNADFSLEKRKVLPPLTDEMKENGYPFFKGELTLVGNYDYDGKCKAELKICGRFISADIIINGEKMPLVLDDRADITKLLRKGKNDIKVVLKSSLRNLFGPHHFSLDAEGGVSPYLFTFRGGWKNGLPNYYTDNYSFVRFGARKIILTEITD